MSVGVVLVDPIPLFREGLAATVTETNDLDWLGASCTAQEALRLQQRRRPQVMLIDSVLDPRGYVTKMLTHTDPGLAVLVLVRAPHWTAEYVRQALASGAEGLVSRSAPPERLIDAIRRTYADRRYLDPALAALTSRRTTKNRFHDENPLSRRELQVLRWLADGLDAHTIARTMAVSTEAVEDHITHLLRKLHARGPAHAVGTAYRVGLLAPQR
jgi:DNA-binding NarL/FixJ family response regulator